MCAACTRLDGRKYAVKKIKLQPGGSSSSYSRILREVATLSRLQNPHVMRYYQAWTEQAQVGGAGGRKQRSRGCGDGC
jgi:serine/threonine protein kinase